MSPPSPPADVTVDAPGSPSSLAVHGLLGALRDAGGAAEAEASGPGLAGPAPALQRGDLVGRYVVTGPLGRGGMGAVYAAYDPELDRKVAVKLLHAGAGQAAEARARLLREAQALARLAHPGVVAVHDVGALGDRVWLAMEFVAGQTLAAWQRERPRRWQEVLGVFRRAGEGLAAAHAAGLVHRDVKPDNVMVGADGRVRVMDFGLARAGQPEPAARPRDALADRRPRPRGAVTRTGALMGTPGYMSPEQWLGEPTDARTDQFSFCVALWEALHGERPFAGATPPELMHAVLEGRRRPPPPGRRVPAWLRRALERGLAVDPARRWPAMRPLLDVLAGGAARRRRRLLALVGLVALALAAAGLAARGLVRRRGLAACAAEGDVVHALWDARARADVAAALRGVGVPFAAAAAGRLPPALDAWTAGWADAGAEVCRRHRVDRTWTPATALRARECLLAARDALAGLLSALRAADVAAATHAVSAAATLPSPGACLDARRLAAHPAPPAAVRADVAALARALARLHARRLVVDAPGELARARALQVRADALAWPPLQAHARMVAADLARDPGAAAALLEDAFFLALAAGDDALAADAAISLTAVVGDRLARGDDGLRWGRWAAAALVRLGRAGSLREAALAGALAATHRRRRDLPAALRLAAAAAALRERLLAPEHPSLAAALAELAALHAADGRPREALDLHARALALRRRGLGDEHPAVAASLHALARVHLALGDLPAASALRARALGPGPGEVPPAGGDPDGAPAPGEDDPAAGPDETAALTTRPPADP
jgi:hypothetical protein